MEDILLLTRRDLWRSPIMERQRLIYKPKKPTLQIKMLASRRTVLKTFGPYIRIIGVKMIPLDLGPGRKSEDGQHRLVWRTKAQTEAYLKESSFQSNVSISWTVDTCPVRQKPVRGP